MKPIAKKLLSVLSVAVFITTVAGPAGNALAQEPWPVWPREGAQPPPATVGETGEQAGEKIGSTVDYGTIGKYALVGALIVGGAIAIGSGGGGDTTSSHTPQ
jgi:hypothetical protein